MAHGALRRLRSIVGRSPFYVVFARGRNVTFQATITLVYVVLPLERPQVGYCFRSVWRNVIDFPSILRVAIMLVATLVIMIIMMTMALRMDDLTIGS